MGRYNISKADSKELINEVQNSSSGDGGIKHYYYKIVNNPPKNILELLGQMSAYGNVNSILYRNYADQIVKISAYFTEDWIQIPVSVITNGDSLGFELTDETCGILMQSENFQYIELPKGDIRIKLLSVGTPEENIDMVMQYLQEITKEEYESMITYKP